MTKCTTLRKKKRKVCIGDLNDEIKLQNRSISEPIFGTVDYDEVFTDDDTVFSIVNTVSGSTYFDGVNTETPITHHVILRYDESITAETWVEFNGKRLNILNVENLDESDEWMMLLCVDTGSIQKEASKVGLT